MKKSDFLKINFNPVVSLIATIVLWDISVRIFKFPEYILPAPIDVIISIFKYRSTIFSAMYVTLYEALTGYGISIVIGVPFGILIVYSKFSKDYIMPLLVMTNSVPKSALAPLFLLWSGYGPLSKI